MTASPQGREKKKSWENAEKLMQKIAKKNGERTGRQRKERKRKRERAGQAERSQLRAELPPVEEQRVKAGKRRDREEK